MEIKNEDTLCSKSEKKYEDFLAKESMKDLDCDYCDVEGDSEGFDYPECAQEQDNQCRFYTFKGQTESEAKALRRTPSGEPTLRELTLEERACKCRCEEKDGTCIYCDAKYNEKYLCDLAPEIQAAKPQPADIHLFVGQNKEMVKELIKKSNQQVHKDEFTHRDNLEPHLCFEDCELDGCGSEDMDVEVFYKKQVDERYHDVDASMASFALWRKLAAVSEDEPLAEEENKNLAEELLDDILKKIKKIFPHLNLSWDSHWTKALQVNGASTNISLHAIVTLYDAMIVFVSETEAKDRINDMIITKLSSMFARR